MRSRRSAFTLIELLVVVAIIAVLIGLLIPAVQKVRGAAARTQCLNNLKQIGLALHGHHDAYKAFPYSKRTSKPHRSWAPDTLPFLEQANVVSSANFNLNEPWWRTFASQTESPLALSATAIPNGTTSQLFLAIFLCPSTPIPQRIQNKSETAPEQNKIGACGDYFVPEGVSVNINANGPLPAGQQFASSLPGVMEPFPNKTTLLSATDGTSNTIMVGECAGREDVWRGRTRAPAVANKAATDCARAQGGAWATNDNTYAIGSSLTPWCTGTTLAGSMPTPMRINATNEFGYLYYSFHDGGANFAFADGSVRFLSEGVALYTLASLTTRSGGETISEPY